MVTPAQGVAAAASVVSTGYTLYKQRKRLKEAEEEFAEEIAELERIREKKAQEERVERQLDVIGSVQEGYVSADQMLDNLSRYSNDDLWEDSLILEMG